MKIKTKIILTSTILFSLVMLMMIIGASKDLKKDYLLRFTLRAKVIKEKIITEIRINRNININDLDLRNVNSGDYSNCDYIISENGKILNTSLKKVKEEWLEKLQKEKIRDIIEVAGRRLFYFTDKILDKYNLLIIDYSQNSIRKRDFHRKLFFIFIPIYYLISVLVTYMIAYFAFKPVEKMIKNLDRITAANLHLRIPLPKAKDEIYRLGIKLNGMIDSLEKSFKSQKRFVADASHQLRTPLTIIRMNLEMILKEENNIEKRENIKNALEEIDRLNELSTFLMTTAKLESGLFQMRVQKLRIDELVIDVIQKFSVKLKEKIELNIDEIKEITADYNLLYQVFYNLLDNSYKYGGENVKIKVTITSESKFNTLIIIEDDGIGIKKEDLNKIFNRFFRSDEIRAKVDGNGLGLSIVKKIIELHKGKISIESEFGKYTKVSVEL